MKYKLNRAARRIGLQPKGLPRAPQELSVTFTEERPSGRPLKEWMNSLQVDAAKKPPVRHGTFWDGPCGRTHCQKPGARFYNFGSHMYYCAQCAHELSHDDFNKRESYHVWGPGKLLCEYQPTAEHLPDRVQLNPHR